MTKITAFQPKAVVWYKPSWRVKIHRRTENSLDFRLSQKAVRAGDGKIDKETKGKDYGDFR